MEIQPYPLDEDTTNRRIQYPLYAASALAANSFARSSFAAAFPLFGVQMYDSKWRSLKHMAVFQKGGH